MKAETHEFQAEIKKLLDLMIHSLYSNKEIFLRELVSNASDALDRLRFEALTQPDLIADDKSLEIRFEPNPEGRTLTLHDNGIGMSREELIENIGTIAHSGSKAMLERLGEIKDGKVPPEFIGQFGVGFYSSFMVAERVEITTRRAGQSEAWHWVSQGDGRYTIEPAQRERQGTSVTLHLKATDADNGLEDFTSEWVLQRIVKKYSDFVSYPIRMEVLRDRTDSDPVTGQPKEGAEKKVETEDRTLNSLRAIWDRPQAEVKAEEYREFYRHIAHDWNEPFETIVQKAEGRLEYNALLFIPKEAPEELYYQAYKGGLQLYVKKVKIIEHCEDLLPNYLRFVRGVVECNDLPLNVSREMLQHTREIGQIKKALTKKLLDVLERIQSEGGERYLELWKNYGRAVKEGAATDFDNRDRLNKLLLFASSRHPSELTSLAQYVARMPAEQQEIFYLTGESRPVVENSPQLEAIKAKGWEVLFLTEPVDELLMQHLFEFEGKKLKSAGKGELDLGDDKEKEAAKQEREELQKKYAAMLEALQKHLDTWIKDVRLSSRLVNSPACLVGAPHDYSPRMEKLLLKGDGGGPKQRRILEINATHPVLARMHERFARDAGDPVVLEAADLLFGQALLAEGSDLPDPVRFGKLVAEFMVRGFDAANLRTAA